MQTVKTLSLILLCAALLGACGLKGPLYLSGESPSTTPDIGQDLPPDMDSTDNTQVIKDNRKKDSF